MKYQIDVVQHYESNYSDIPNYRTFTTKRCDRIEDALDEVAKLKCILFTGCDRLSEIKRINDNTILSVIQHNFKGGVRHIIHIIEK